MFSEDRRLPVQLAAGALMLGVALAAFFLGRATSGEKVRTEVETVTVPAASSNRASTGQVLDSGSGAAQTGNPAPTPQTQGHGPYDTMEKAVAYVQTLGDELVVNNPGTTWQQGAELHVLFATPAGTASYGGDYYFFFVDGYLVGQYSFTKAQAGLIVDSTSYSVTFSVYQPSDPHCCPTGGASTVVFHWDGSSLLASGSMQGAQM